MNFLSREEFEQLLNRQKNRICKLAYCYLHNMDDVQDVYQTVMERFLKYQPVFENEEHEKAWFITTTANVCKNICESAWKKKVDLCESERNIDEPINNRKVIVINEHKKDQSHTYDDEYQSYGAELVADNVIRLPEKYRLVIHLFYYEELSTNEIAKMLGITPGSVRTQLNRARNMLKEYLQQELGNVKGGKLYESKSL